MVFDRDSDGKVNQAELGQMMAALGRVCSDDELKAMIGAAGGGSDLNLAQFQALMSNLKTGTADEKEIVDAFAVFDKTENKDGFIKAKELKNAMLTMGDKPLSEEECSQLMEACDIDGDGRIDYRNFIKFTMSTKIV